MDQILKLNNSDQLEHFEVILDEYRHPIAFANKLKELIDSGMTEIEAHTFIAKNPIEMEFYYEIGSGLMAVESGAVEAGTIYSPYSGQLYEDYDE